MVSILAANPFFVCWAQGGSHLSAGSLAIAAVVVVVVFLPMVALYWVQRDPRLLADLARLKSRICISTIATAVDSSNDTAQLPPQNAILAPILSDFRPDAWYVKGVHIQFIPFSPLLSCAQNTAQTHTRNSSGRIT